MSQRRPRQFDADHLAFIRQLECAVPNCGDDTSTEAAHIRMTDGRIGKVNPGVGQKPHDKFAVPLCGKHHREQHAMNEERFWQTYQRDPVLLALALYSVRGDYEEACRIIRAGH